MLRVMTVIDYYYPFKGGAENIARYIAEESIKKGVSQNILTIASDRIISLQGGKYIPVEKINDKYTIYRFQHARIFGKEKDGPWFQHVTLLKYIIYMIRLRNTYDIIHAHTFLHPAAAAIIAGKIVHKPVVITGHNALFRLKNMVKSGEVPSYCMSLLKFCNQYVAINNNIAKEAHDICSIPKKKISVIYNGIDPVEFNNAQNDEEKNTLRVELGLPLNKRIIIYHGRINENKNIRSLIIALTKINSKYKQKLCLLLIGRGPQKEELKNLIGQFNLGDMVIFLKKQDVITDYLRASDIYCLPSFIEGFSVSLLEAMGCGLLCLASNIAGNKDAITDRYNGLLFNPHDIDDLTTCLSRAFKMVQDGSSNSIQRCARKTVMDKYTTAVMTDKHISLFKKILNTA